MKKSLSGRVRTERPIYFRISLICPEMLSRFALYSGVKLSLLQYLYAEKNNIKLMIFSCTGGTILIKSAFQTGPGNIPGNFLFDVSSYRVRKGAL